MTLLKEICDLWKLDLYHQYQIIPSLKETYRAWTTKTHSSFGVAVEYDGEEVREDFTNATIFSTKMVFAEKTVGVLVLMSKRPETDTAFLNLCIDFVNPGENGEFREALTSHPVDWWRSWKELLGNASIDERVYDVLGELCVLKYYVEHGFVPEWDGPNQSTYDLSTEDFFVEVKSTVNRSKKEVTISSIHQLSNLNKTLYLVFCTFEINHAHGDSINSVVDELRDLGYNVGHVNELLEQKGFGIGKSIRKKRFMLLSMHRYLVDDNFPKVVEQSFVGGTLPVGVTDVSYTVNLSGLEAETLIEVQKHE